VGSTSGNDPSAAMERLGLWLEGCSWLHPKFSYLHPQPQSKKIYNKKKEDFGPF